MIIKVENIINFSFQLSKNVLFKKKKKTSTVLTGLKLKDLF